MEVVAGIFASLVAMALLAGVGLMTVVALCLMAVLGLLTEMSFKRVFFISFGVGLLAPFLVAAGIGSAVADGSLERDMRAELGEVIDLPEEMGEDWEKKLSELQDISRDVDQGNLSDEEAEARVKEIFSDFEDFQINIDVNGDGESGVSIGTDENGVPLELPEAVESGGDAER
ncbi:MAG: hypothetical protein AAGL10_03350 [Pseudomonadota bacterium]